MNTTDAQTCITIKVGEDYGTVWGNEQGWTPVIGGNAIAVRMYYGLSARIYGVRPGYATYGAYKNSDSHPCLFFHVLDVIPSEVNLLVGGSYTYSAVVYSSNSEYKSFTWTSNNTAVATVDGNGNVSAVAPGRATITCTANGGNSFSSVVYVSTKLVQEVTLNKKSYEMSVGGTYTLTATVAPTNATQKTVNWLSSNENVAQVSDAGKVTTIAPGYCSIYAKADDGSGKFAKCLIHVKGTAGSRSDVNGDGQVTVTDAEVVIDEILNQ